ncbi:hypothetical protein [Alkalihalobacillus sp. 1P02AB]|uniref:hypothetical protein n=1 Tax=Alkalihalobacillus sp. 1P02AB TaxID=3132260 RepID=UPI0039A4AF64
MYTCFLCNDTITDAFVGSKNETQFYSCFKCFIQTLKPFKFEEEFVYYPSFGMRDIQLKDSVVFYDNDGQELARVYLEAYEEGFLSYLKEEIARDLNLAVEDITLVIEPHDVQLKK